MIGADVDPQTLGARMATAAKDVEELQTYAEGVMSRADHQAGKVTGIALALLGGIIWSGEPASIRLRGFAGSPANMLWVDIGANTYFFAYNHTAEKIEIRDRTQTGSALHSFDDSNTAADIEAAFRAL
jgi:Integron cassette protein VCH_CASS1 chain